MSGKLNSVIEKPAFLCGYDNPKKGWFWLVEILVFDVVIAVFYASICGAAYVAMPFVYDLFGETSDVNVALFNFCMIVPILIIVFVFGRVIQKRTARSFGFIARHAVRSYAVGLVLGLTAFGCAVGIAVACGSLTIDRVVMNGSVAMLVVLFFSFCVQSMAEEVLCRGYFIGSFSRRYPVVIAVVVSSLMFSSLHILNSGVTALPLVNLVGFGIFAALYYLYTENIWGVAAFHAMWNFAQGDIFGVLVSGGSIDTSVLGSTSVAGYELINGGAFGLEGGLAVSVVMAVAIIIMIVLMRRKKRAKDARHLSEELSSQIR
jgi:membrane protease YdiL (CAAX protease family)